MLPAFRKNAVYIQIFAGHAVAQRVGLGDADDFMRGVIFELARQEAVIVSGSGDRRPVSNVAL